MVRSMRIVTTSAVLLTLAVGNASAQIATNTTPGKPIQLFQVIQQKDGTTVRPHHRARFVRKGVAKTRIVDQKTGATRHEYMQMQPAPEPEQTAATPPAATPTAATATVPANIWPVPDVALPGVQAQSSTLSPPAAPIAASNKPATAANRNEMLTAPYDAVQVTPPSAAQATPPDTAEVTPPSIPQATPSNAVQVAQANMVGPTDVAADQPHDAANTAQASNPVTSWPVQHAMVATAEPQNPNPVGSASWIAHVLAALGGAIAAGALAWVLIDPLPARSYE
jgi:hypothetical protein